MAEELATFAVCSLYLTHLFQKKSSYSSLGERTLPPLNKTCGRFLANLDISICSGLFQNILNWTLGIIENLTNSFFSLLLNQYLVIKSSLIQIHI